LQGKTWVDITDPLDKDVDLAYYERFKKGEINHYSMEKRFVKPDGSTVWVDMLVSQFESLGGNRGNHLCIISDITNRKKIEAKLIYNNEHVKLTGLNNRLVLEKTLESDDSLHLTDKRALVCINLTEIHNLSLRYGFRYSHTILKRIADSLKTFCKENYTLFNTYEYRFVYYVKAYEGKAELSDFCKRITETLNSYLYVHGIVVGIGVLQIDKVDVVDADELLKKLMITSDMAVQNTNDSAVLFYSQELDARIVRENEIGKEITEIVKGIESDRLYLQFQPIFDVVSNQVLGFEALARMKSEQYGLIPPLDFIPLAEKTNMMVPFGEKIIYRALSFSNKLKENGYHMTPVYINISTIQMLENGFSARLVEMINEMKLDPTNIGIELTESVFATDRSEIIAVINELKAAGIKVLIDDFGTGYSSFSRVRELNIDYLKIDKSFIDKLLVLKPEEAITGDIISMAHKLGQIVIAEGVEYEKQLNYLRDNACDRIQGYLFSEPLDEEDAYAVLNKTRQNS